jgi:NAD(P)-dependent dehydrogenase (short-subunit alcohol dehydrogenase family)
MNNNTSEETNQLTRKHSYPHLSASGLGRACVLDICKRGGNAAVLDMNEEQGNLLVKELGSGNDTTRFFPCDVSDTESIAAAVKGVSEWVKETRKPVGGIIPAAGVGRPGLVCNTHTLQYPKTNNQPPSRS